MFQFWNQAVVEYFLNNFSYFYLLLLVLQELLQKLRLLNAGNHYLYRTLDFLHHCLASFNPTLAALIVRRVSLVIFSSIKDHPMYNRIKMAIQNIFTSKFSLFDPFLIIYRKNEDEQVATRKNASWIHYNVGVLIAHLKTIH